MLFKPPTIQLPLVIQKLDKVELYLLTLDKVESYLLTWDKVESYLLTLEEALGIAGCMQGWGGRGGPLTSLLLTRGLLPHLTLHSMRVQPLCCPAIHKCLC